MFRFVRPSSLSTPSTTKPTNHLPPQPKTLDPITLFHNPSLSASNRALQILQRASTAASEASISADTKANRESSQSTATSAHDALHNVPTNRGDFQLDVTTAPPTTDQLRNIFEYLGSGAGARTVPPSEVVPGATDARDALRKFAEAAGNGDGGFVRPVVSFPRSSCCQGLMSRLSTGSTARRWLGTTSPRFYAWSSSFLRRANKRPWIIRCLFIRLFLYHTYHTTTHSTP